MITARTVRPEPVVTGSGRTAPTAWAKAVPGAAFHVVDGPHMLPLERPREFGAVLGQHFDLVYPR